MRITEIFELGDYGRSHDHGGSLVMEVTEGTAATGVVAVVVWAMGVAARGWLRLRGSRERWRWRLHGCDQEFAFGPVSLVVTPGAKIAVVNQDRDPHALTARDKSFDNGTIISGQRGEFTAPNSPGTYPFICTVHPYTAGTLIVK